jgi:hypothetical protein
MAAVALSPKRGNIVVDGTVFCLVRVSPFYSWIRKPPALPQRIDAVLQLRE